MKTKKIYILFILALFFLGGCGQGDNQEVNHGIPNLPRPIAKERALVTSAGQGMEGLIIAKLASQLNISNYYRHRAEVVDLQDVRSVVISLGYSAAGLESAYLDSDKEEKRIKELTIGALAQRKPILLIHIGGMERRSPLNDKLATWIAKRANYLIVLEDSNQDGFFSQLARTNGIPLTVVRSLEGIKVPLNSAFR